MTTHSRDSQTIKESLETWMQHRLSPRKSSESYDEYLVAMKRAHHAMSEKDLSSPRARYRHKTAAEKDRKNTRRYSRDMEDLMHISTIASMVPDEIIYNYADYSLRSYETALMFIDVSGFTDLCESYTKSGRGGPSKLTQVLNSYIGAMVQEILTHNGDVLKFSGDAFLSMWRKTAKMTMQDVVHTAIDCGLTIQKNYATHVTDLGVTLKVKVAISAGVSHFALIGGDPLSTYIIVGQPVWDVKAAEYMSHAGDVLTSASTWAYVNEAEYCTQPCGDGRHTKVLGVGVTWKRVEKIDFASTLHYSRDLSASVTIPSTMGIGKAVDNMEDALDTEEAAYKEYSLRPAVISALRSSWWPSLRRFMVTPVLRAVDNDEPMDFLTEVRHVVVVFLNIITKTVTADVLVDTVGVAYKQVCSVTLESGGLVNKVSMFDKDMMFLVVFGLRGLKLEDEAQKALLCAFQLKETVRDPNILRTSIGVTSGRTYCGVVGHVLRREYTVIGSSVNKAARLMMCYPDKVTCDKETFVRSKLDLDMFRLMEPKQLKGIAKPGPIYEFSKSGWPERRQYIRHPTLGRNEELRTYRSVLENAATRQRERFTRYRDLRFGIIVMGPRLVGKTRLVDEFLNMTPNQHKVLRISLTANDKISYGFTRLLLQKIHAGSNTNLKNVRDIFANKIRRSIGMMEVTPLQIHALNIIFNMRFPLPETFDYTGDVLSEPTVKEIVKQLFNVGNEYLMVVAVGEGQFIDDESWRVLLLVLDTKSIFIIIVINDHDQLSDIAKTSVANNIFVKMHLRGIDRWYHAALACQLLDVQAIPADLEKVLESASGGLPGWIQNFVISLVQRGELTVVTVPRSEAVDAGAVMPLAAMLQRTADESTRDVDIVSTTTSTQSNKLTKTGETIAENETIQMAVLAENYNFDDMKVDMTMDVIILKTYDSLTPFEKMLLKCGSVLGDIFSRRMLLHLLQSDSQRKVAMAVAKLFEIRVLECEGGDFSRNTSMVLIHSAPVPTDAVKPPNCACLGTRAPPDCRDLPMYSFCGYMKFRHSLFRTTTYELLTENQKQEMHSRALMYLERYTRRCTSCGSGCFIRLFGVRSDDGMIIESRELRRVRQQIAALSAETRIVSETLSDAGITSIDNAKPSLSDTTIVGKEEKRIVDKEEKSSKKPKPVRSFSSLDVENCECLPILLSVYNQVIDHCKVVGDCNKLFETYMEYVDLSLLTMNIPQAIRLLMDAENDIEVEKCCKSEICKIPWIKDYKYGRIMSWRGCCMLDSGDISEARKHLLKAMELFGCKFPESKAGVKISDMQASLQQFWSLYIHKRNKPAGWVGKFYDHISRTLSQLFRLFVECKEMEKATLAAKWSLKFARKSNSTFRILCLSYGNMISIYRQKHNFSKCLKLEKLAMDICHRKSGNLDITEVFSVCVLYTNIFFFYVEQGRKSESLDFGLSIIPMMSSQQDVTIGQMLVQWMLKLLLIDLRIHEMVMIMREFYYMTDFYDLSSETWYYYHAMIILLDTGYCVESYGTCEKFYIKQGDAILRSKTPEAAWNFFAVMWLVTLRVGAWERSILWEDKLKKILPQVYQCTEFNIMLLIRLVECFMIGLVNEIDNRNLKKTTILEMQVQNMIKNINKMSKVMPLYKSRFLLLRAYYHQVKNNKSIALRYINKSSVLAKNFGNNVLTIWIEHTKEHWKGTLNPKLKDYWTEHIEVHSMLDYKTFDPETSKIVPYTLPLPRDFD